MAFIAACGFELNSAVAEPLGNTSSPLSGTASISSTQKRSGAFALRCNPASGASGSLTTNPSINGFPSGAKAAGFGVYFATLPSVTRVMLGHTAEANLRINSDGTLSWYNQVTLVGTSTTALVTGVWYWISFLAVTNNVVGEALLAINDQIEVTGQTSSGSWTAQIGFSGTEASAVDAYFDDLVLDDASALLPVMNMALLLPVSDNARGANWQAGAAGTTNLWDAVNNIPPAGVASASETNTTNIEHTGGANNSYDANLTTYSSAGINPWDTVRGIVPFFRHGEDVATGTKLLNCQLTANPSGSASGNFAAGGDTGAHAAEPTGWLTVAAPAVANPTVTLGSNPVLRVNRPETVARTACVDLMGAYVAWQPGTPPWMVERSVYPQVLVQ